MDLKMYSRARIKSATELLETYSSEKHPFFYINREKTLRSEGIAHEVDGVPMDDERFEERLANAFTVAKLKGVLDPIVVGAIPFSRDEKPHLHIPFHVDVAKESFVGGSEVETAVKAISGADEYPLRADYEGMVARGVEAIRIGELDKLVLGRTLRLTSESDINHAQLLSNLASENQNGFTFAVALPSEEPKRRILMGASPELLVRKKGQLISVNPLAGSRSRSADPLEDQRRADELLASEKDLHEHALVVEAIAEQLRPICDEIHIPTAPSVIHTEAMWHLSTYISAVPSPAHRSASAIANVLHPTPAVCGFPRAIASNHIKELEEENRQFFTGLVGWENEYGDGEWAIAIRCAEVSDTNLVLFAGAGIVANSKPVEEADETAAKFQTMMRALRQSSGRGGKTSE